MTTMKSLPEEIVIDILTRLPIKSILRFKSVSKLWSTLSTNPHFTAAHLRRSSSTNPLFIVQHDTPGDFRTSIFDANFTVLQHDLPMPENRLDYGSPSILGSCNGLLCIEFCSDYILLWNPATKLFRQVPSFNLKSPFTHLTRFVPIGERTGFGFNSEIEDYKLVKFAMFYYKDRRSEDQMIWDGLEVKAVVFSWKTWSWKILKDAHIPAAKYDNQVAANGHLYWIGSRDGMMTDFVLEFNFVNDSFRTIEWSDDHHLGRERMMNRLDMNTRIAVIKSYLDLSVYNEDSFEVLVIGENGIDVKGSKWELLCKYGCFDGSSAASFDYDGYWNGLQVMMQRDRNRSYLYLFDPRRNVVRLIDDIALRFYGVINYVESLVPVCGVEE
ncbi:F-box/kelch-repeat protein At3g06240 [Linum perenne]